MTPDQIGAALTQALMKQGGEEDPGFVGRMVASIIHHFHDDSGVQIAMNSSQAMALQNKFLDADIKVPEGNDRYREDDEWVDDDGRIRAEGYNQHGHGGHFDGGYIRTMIQVTEMAPGGGKYQGLLFGGRVNPPYPESENAEHDELWPPSRSDNGDSPGESWSDYCRNQTGGTTESPVTQQNCTVLGWPLCLPDGNPSDESVDGGMRWDPWESECAAGRDWPMRLNPLTEDECEDDDDHDSSDSEGCQKICGSCDDPCDGTANPCIRVRDRWDHAAQRCLILNLAEDTEDRHTLEIGRIYMGIVVGWTQPKPKRDEEGAIVYRTDEEDEPILDCNGAQIPEVDEPGVPVVATFANETRMARILGFNPHTEAYSWEEVFPQDDGTVGTTKSGHVAGDDECGGDIKWVAEGYGAAVWDERRQSYVDANADDAYKTLSQRDYQLWPAYEVNGGTGVAAGTIVTMWKGSVGVSAQEGASSDPRMIIDGYYLFDCGLTNELKIERYPFSPDPQRNWWWTRQGPPLFSPGYYRAGDVVRYAKLSEGCERWYIKLSNGTDGGLPQDTSHPAGPTRSPDPSKWRKLVPFKGVKITDKFYYPAKDGSFEWGEWVFDSHGQLAELCLEEPTSGSSASASGSGSGSAASGSGSGGSGSGASASGSAGSGSEGSEGSGACETVCVSGAGTSSVNGTYNKVTSETYPLGYWEKSDDSTTAIVKSSATEWYIGDNDANYYEATGVDSSVECPTEITWITTNGEEPAPSISIGECPPGSGSGGSEGSEEPPGSGGGSEPCIICPPGSGKGSCPCGSGAQVPACPGSGTWILACIDGTMTWIATTTKCPEPGSQ